MIKKTCALLLTALIILSLSSCTFANNITSLLGFDSHDYIAEKVTGEVDPEGDIGKKIQKMLYVLSIDSANLPEFNDMKDSVELCRDSLLNFMLNENYPMYAGNSKLIEKAAELYPEYKIIQAIPQNDFEAEMYKYFGGSVKITHKSSDLFLYFSKAGIYSPVSPPVDGGLDMKVISIDETENTYRVEFSCSKGEENYNYFALIIKRDDGTLYFKTVIKNSPTD